MTKERPVLSNLVNANTSETEKFQNEVLRPIIKMKHDLLIVFMKTYLHIRKINFAVLSEEKKKNKVKSVLEKDQNLKNQILGIVIGDFSVEEFLVYANKPSEFNKRMIQIIIQRFQSNTDLIKI